MQSLSTTTMRAARSWGDIAMRFSRTTPWRSGDPSERPYSNADSDRRRTSVKIRQIDAPTGGDPSYALRYYGTDVMRWNPDDTGVAMPYGSQSTVRIMDHATTVRAAWNSPLGASIYQYDSAHGASITQHVLSNRACRQGVRLTLDPVHRREWFLTHPDEDTQPIERYSLNRPRYNAAAKALGISAVTTWLQAVKQLAPQQIQHSIYNAARVNNTKHLHRDMDLLGESARWPELLGCYGELLPERLRMLTIAFDPTCLQRTETPWITTEQVDAVRRSQRTYGSLYDTLALNGL